MRKKICSFSTSKRKIKEFDAVVEYSPIPNCRDEGGGVTLRVFGRFHQTVILPPITTRTFKDYIGRLS